MPTSRLEAREHSDEEVKALPEERQPEPFDPWPLNAAAPQQGQGHGRRSLSGDRWCPYCQTPLVTTLQSCPRCHPVRRDLVTSGRLVPAQTATPSDPGALDAALDQLLDAVDEMARVVALASAHQHNGRTLKKEHVENMFMACKEVMVMADGVHDERKRLRE
jgi:hypothetical protein